MVSGLLDFGLLLPLPPVGISMHEIEPNLVFYSL